MSCPHGMPKPANCVSCMDEGLLPPPPRPAAPTVEAVFPARFASQCAGCNLPVHVGARLARMSDGAYLHEECV